ncbi:MAG: beta-ketoacyl-[acyl-carrier-protein] synthase family protein, partial [Bacteroidales bacterium]|nr:beta-ketoacyl-[acyl-carrier-protein] synthase family protein [Bacteroidales bacterium]
MGAAAPVWITGSGVVSAIGLDKRECLASLLAERSGVGEVQYLQTSHHEFPVGEVKLSNGQMRERLGIAPDALTTRTALMGMLALQEALQEAEVSAGMLPET